MWIGPPDLLSNSTHKCLKLALMLRSPFWDVMLVSFTHSYYVSQELFLGKKVTGTYQTARRQNSEDGDLKATFTHHRTPTVHMLWEDPQNMFNLQCAWTNCNVTTHFWQVWMSFKAKMRYIPFSGWAHPEHTIHSFNSSAHLQFFIGGGRDTWGNDYFKNYGTKIMSLVEL